jgi:hypothetical protein
LISNHLCMDSKGLHGIGVHCFSFDFPSSPNFQIWQFLEIVAEHGCFDETKSVRFAGRAKHQKSAGSAWSKSGKFFISLDLNLPTSAYNIQDSELWGDRYVLLKHGDTQPNGSSTSTFKSGLLENETQISQLKLPL